MRFVVEPLNNTAAFIDTRILLRPILDKTVLVRLLNPLVDNCTRPVVSHLSEHRSLVTKGPRWDSVALSDLLVLSNR